MTSRVGATYGQFAGQPWETSIAQPWEPQPYSPYEHRPRWDPDISIDPGIYATPDTGWNGDLGIYVTPDPGWGGDPGIVTQPQVAQPQVAQPQVAATEDVDRIGALTTGDHVKHGARSMVVPGIISGALVGALAAAAAPSAKAGVFAIRGTTSAVGSVIGGAATGLLVAASSPKDGDNLAARYAVAGGLLGGVGGAFAPAQVRGISVAIGAAGNAAVGWFIGKGLERKVAAEGAASAAGAGGGATPEEFDAAARYADPRIVTGLPA